jgi:hypothetical protein
LTVGSWQLRVGSWQLAVGSWQLRVGSWQLAVGSWQLALESWQLRFDRSNKEEFTVGETLFFLLNYFCAIALWKLWKNKIIACCA